MKTIDDYRYMMKHFNQMSFKDKIKYIQKHNNILTLASDYNWWVVKVKDEKIQEELFNNEETFEIYNAWGHEEMQNLISLLDIDNTDI
jgi:hypothetical protein